MILTRFPLPGTTEFPLRSNTCNDQVSAEKQICPDGNEAESSIARSFLFVLAAGNLEAIFLFTATVFCLNILWIKLASGLKNFHLGIFLTLIYLLMSSLDVHSLFCLKWGLVVQSWPAWNSLCSWTQMCLSLPPKRWDWRRVPPHLAPLFNYREVFMHGLWTCSFLIPHTTPPSPFFPLSCPSVLFVPLKVFTSMFAKTNMTLCVCKSKDPHCTYILMMLYYTCLKSDLKEIHT